MAATIAPSMSLSPKANSATDTVSFSLTTGTTPRSRRRSRVFRALRYPSRSVTSRRVSSTWPHGMPLFERTSAYASVRRTWPAAAQAWSVGMSVGLASKPSTSRPAAAAPEETITTRVPSAASSPTWSQSERMKSWSRAPEPSTSVEVPSLATTRRAAPITRHFRGTRP